LTDNCRSMDSKRLMALMQVKMNSHLLDDEKMESVMQELVALLQTSQDVADIYQELQDIEDEEKVTQRVQYGALQAMDVEDDTDEEEAEPEGEQ
jgi:DNA mismatch repair ATPase MutS